MRKPSAALVVASAALVMATIGTSVAASGYTITSSKQIKAGSISLSDLSPGARKALRGERGPAGPPGLDGEDGLDGEPGDDGEDGAGATDLWAQIGAGGTVNASSDGVTALNPSDGVYYVDFGRDVTHCAALAVQGSIPNFSALGAAAGGNPGPCLRLPPECRGHACLRVPEPQLGRGANATRVGRARVVELRDHALLLSPKGRPGVRPGLPSASQRATGWPPPPPKR